jgi:nicotinamidase-related amidase
MICGFTSFLCCDTTAREAFQLGYRVYYIEDAISEFEAGGMPASELHRAVNIIQGVVFSTVVNTRDAVSLIEASSGE